MAKMRIPVVATRGIDTLIYPYRSPRTPATKRAIVAVALMMEIEYVVRMAPAPLTWVNTWMACGEERVRNAGTTAKGFAHRKAVESPRSAGTDE